MTKEEAIKEAKSDGRLLCSKLKKFNGDRDVVFEAINKTPEAYQYVSKELKGDKDILLMAVKKPSNDFFGLLSS